VGSLSRSAIFSFSEESSTNVSLPLSAGRTTMYSVSLMDFKAVSRGDVAARSFGLPDVGSGVPTAFVW
jgi:hypothetical protein